ncbi:MAG: peroxiredoxin family protein [Syntrophales bacterium]
MKKKHLFLILLLGALLAVLTWSVYSQQKKQDSKSQARDTAPDFILEDLSGRDIRLSDYRGSAVLLVFGTTWCPNCRTEVSEVKSIYSRYKDRGLVVFNIDIMETREKVASFAKKRDIPYPVLLDKDGKVAEWYGVVGVPIRVLVDKEGRIACWGCRHLDEKLNQVLGESAPERTK